MKNKLLSALLCCAVVLPSFASISEKELQKKIQGIEKSNNSIIGISATYIEANKTVSYKSNQRFFMASTIKLPIALAFCTVLMKIKNR